jgi:hypothetical protein
MINGIGTVIQGLFMEMMRMEKYGEIGMNTCPTSFYQ